MSESEAIGEHWCIVGGGVLGLVLAKRLVEAGERVTVLEATPEIGGLASAWNLGDFTWDRHYHVTLLSDQSTRDLLRELELEDQMRWVETKTGFFADGKLVSLSNNWEFLRFPLLSLWEKFRLGVTIFAASKIRDWQSLESIPVADWLRKWSGIGTFRKIWQPLLRAKLGATYEKVSAVFIAATIARMYRARQSGLKKEMFGYLPGGYARVFKAFAARLVDHGVQIECNRAVKQIIVEGGQTVGVEFADGNRREFDHVVLTIPSPVIADLCRSLSDSEKTQHREIEYLVILCASVVLKRPLSPYYVTNITESWVPFTAVIEMTALVDPAELAGHHLVYLPRYVDANDPSWQWTDDQLRETFVSALERMVPDFSRSDVEFFKVSRVKRVMALPTLGYSERLPSMTTSLPGVYAVNSAQIVYGTLNVNEVIDVAERAYSEILLPAIRSRTETSAALPIPEVLHV